MSEIIEYKCPCCGGAVNFDSSRQKMKCPYCDTEFDIEAITAYNEDLEKVQAEQPVWENHAGGEWQDGETDGMRIYRCESCGGEIVGDENTGAATCPYCGNNIVVAGQFSGDLKPDFVIPFQVDKKAAKEGLKRHIQGKRLLPKFFGSENHLDEIKGIYVPFWLFDAEADGHVRYRGTKVRVWSDANYNYTETRFYAVFRGGTMEFEQVPVDGSVRMPDDLMESIEPFDFSKAVPFQTAYLAGYLADRYDVDAEESVKRANDRIRQSTEHILSDSVMGYTTLTPEGSRVNLKNGKARYALYPVWILNTTWNGKQYLFAMNGQTGKFVGNLPMDKKAYWKWRVVWTVIFFAVLMLLFSFFSLV